MSASHKPEWDAFRGGYIGQIAEKLAATHWLEIQHLHTAGRTIIANLEPKGALGDLIAWGVAERDHNVVKPTPAFSRLKTYLTANPDIVARLRGEA